MGITDASDLPMEKRYRIVELQREELKVQTKIDDSSHWRDPSLDEFESLIKDSLKRARVQSTRGSIFWALVERTPARANGIFGEDGDVGDEDLVPGDTVLICHCESHAYDCAFRNLDGELKRGLSRTIAAVFTLPEYRRQGLASFFLKGIQMRMATYPDTIGSVLYSEIGPTFYDKLGWRVHESKEAKLNVEAAFNTSMDNGVAREANLTTLHLDQALDEILVRDNARVMLEMMDSKYDDQEVFALLPMRESTKWRELITSFRGLAAPPTQTGVRIDDDAFLVWCHHVKESTLYIVHSRLPADRPTAIVQLLRAAITEARKFGLKSVVLWDPVDTVFSPAVTSAVEVVKQDRDDSLSSLIVFDKHRTKADNAVLPVWLNDEPQAWV